MSFEHEITFRSMGSDVRLLIGRPLLCSDPAAWGGGRSASAPMSRASRHACRAFAPTAS